MADTVVNFLLTYLTQLLTDEIKLLNGGVEEKVVLLKQELERMNAFLKSSEGKRDEHDLVRVVVTQMRDVAYEAQDVIDNYVVDVVNYTRKGKLTKFFKKADHTKMLHNVNSQIEIIKSKMNDIYDNKDKYDISEGDSVAIAMEALALAETVERRRRNVEEDDIVGFDGYATEVTDLIVKGKTSLEVVSIIGMVGCGKTTLARKVYKDPQISNLFDCTAWEFVTEEYNSKELLVSILRSFNAIPEYKLKQIKKEKNEEESDSNAKTQEIAILKNMLQNYLADMRYLIVLDDMWSSQVLEEIGDAFPDDNIGSRILITSRSGEVASKICTIEPYKLQPLNDEDSWILLSKKVFRDEKPPPNLETEGRKIAIACKGLPLSIVVVAGILRSKEKSERVWKKVIGNVNWFISKEDNLVREIVRLSYESLPRRLKPCFLYFGIYPEDYEIHVRKLIQLWIAEGFIIESGNGSMIEEDVAEEYLEELIRRNMIQVESRRSDGGVKTCRIHDLLRELCLSESKEDKFLEVRTDIHILNIGKPRKLSLHGSTSYYMYENPSENPSIRSLFSFDKDEYKPNRKVNRWIRKNLKLIRVLDMGQLKSSSEMLSEFEKSIHLRYIRTQGHVLFLDFVCELRNLETLDIIDSRSCDIPDEIWKLKRLRHIYMSGNHTKFPKLLGRKSLKNLQTLSMISLDTNALQQLEKGKFPNLRKLGINLTWSEAWNPMELLKRLQCLTQLNTLKVVYCNGNLTDVVGFPPNITKITLVECFNFSNIVNHLGSLSKLLYLKITGSYTGDIGKFELKCTKSGCFPQLQMLKMTNLKIVSWNMGKGTMPLLRRLVINKCELSTTMPSVESFPSLQEIEVLESSEEVAEKLQHLALKDSCKLTVSPVLG